AAAPEQEQTGPSKSAAPPLGRPTLDPGLVRRQPHLDAVGRAWRDGNHRSTRAAGGRRGCRSADTTPAPVAQGMPHAAMLQHLSTARRLNYGSCGELATRHRHDEPDEE